MRILGLAIGLALFGGLIVLAIAGVSAAIGILVTAVAIAAMIFLGGLMGGRSTPDRAPYPSQGEVGPEADAGGGADSASDDEPEAR